MVLRGLLLLSLLELRRWWALISVWDSHVGEVRGRVSGKRLGRMLVRLERLLWGKAGLVRRTGGDAGGTWRLRVLGMTLEVLRSRLLLKRRLRVILNLLGRTRWSGSRRKWASGVSWLERAHLARRVRDVANGWAGVAGWGAARREGERAWKSDGGLVQLSRELNEERVALLSHGLDARGLSAGSRARPWRNKTHLDVVIGEDVALPRLLRTRNEDIPEDRPPSYHTRLALASCHAVCAGRDSLVQQTLRCLNRWPFPFFLADPGISRERSRSVRPASFLWGIHRQHEASDRGSGVSPSRIPACSRSNSCGDETRVNLTARG